MSLLAKRRAQGAKCCVCQSPDFHFKEEESVIKPAFICGSCGHKWSYGYDGGIYASLLSEQEKATLDAWLSARKKK